MANITENYCSPYIKSNPFSPQNQIQNTNESIPLKKLNQSPPTNPILSPSPQIHKRIKLLHLLIAAAESLSGDRKTPELSRVILARLNDLLPPPVSSADRLIAQFSHALARLLPDSPADQIPPPVNPAAFTAAAQLFNDTSPYVNFGHFTVNQAIVEAVGGERRVHIVDFDVMEGAQWAPLLQGFVSRKDGPAPSHVKITAVTARRKAAAAAAREAGRMLAEFAASIGLPFSFARCRLDRAGRFRPEGVKVLRGEAVVFNCALQLPHGKENCAVSIRSFLAGAAELGAKVVTLVEEEGRGGGGEGKMGFLGWFKGELRRNLMIWDGLEKGIEGNEWVGKMVEKVVFGPRIVEGLKEAFLRGGGEEEESWSEWMLREKFGRVGLSYFNHWQARLLIGLFNVGYSVEEDGENKIVLCWKSSPLVSASVWVAPTVTPANLKGF